MSTLPWQAAHPNETPAVSVILFCRDAAATLRRSIESLARQTYRNFEYVVQDGASTDGTLDLLREYEGKLNIRLVSEPDDGPADGFWRALRRCRGQFLATCLADEELMPDALENAVQLFSERPYLGAITGDAYVTDAAGNIQSTHKSAPFSFARYLAAEYCPYWSSSFFSIRALKAVGVLDSRWSADSLEFEIWCRLAEDYEIAYVPRILSKYGIHDGQLSNQGKRALTELKSRLQIIREKVFRPGGVFGDDDDGLLWRDRCILLQQVNLLNHLLAYRVPEAEVLAREIGQSKALQDFLATGLRAAMKGSRKLPAHEEAARQIYGLLGTRLVTYRLLLLFWRIVPTAIRAAILPVQKARVRRFLRLPR